MMKDYYQKSMRALQLAGMSDRTQQCYTRAVRQLVDFYGKSPDLITEQELQDYFLHRRNVSKWSAATLRICYSGIKFFFINVLKRQWHALELINAKREQRLPDVLSLDEVWAILNAVTTPQNKAYLTTVYTCGLRLNEALFLQVSDIDGQRMRIHVHRGKGAKDRYVPLPAATLEILRDCLKIPYFAQFLCWFKKLILEIPDVFLRLNFLNRLELEQTKQFSNSLLDSTGKPIAIKT